MINNYPRVRYKIPNKFIGIYKEKKVKFCSLMFISRIFVVVKVKA